MNYGVEIELKVDTDFLKIIETLTRIGIQSSNNSIVQTCHILHKRGKYYILHFKELLMIDKVSKSDLSKEDIERRNGIVKLLSDWNLCEVKAPLDESSLNRIKIISFKDKSKYNLKQNYTIGKRMKNL